MSHRTNSILIVLGLILFSLLASYRLFQSGYFSMQDDMHVFRLQQLDQCLRDGQIPCRQIADGGLGYGYPLFNYYSPLPYAIAELFHLFKISFIDSLKISFIIPNFVRAISMFLLASTFFGPVGGLVSSAFYTLAPYFAVDLYVRGALAEFWALSILPLILFSVVKSKQKTLIWSLVILLLSHNLTTLYFLPFLFLFAIINQKTIFLIKNSLLPFLISCFFIIPAFFEKNLVTVDTMTQGYFSYVNHFTTLKQLFISPFWGYGASQWGNLDGMSFQVGFLLWLIPLISIITLLINHKFNKNIFFFFASSLVFLFLTHNKSSFIWSQLSLLQYYQFPWRFLGPAILCLCLISGHFVQLLKPKLLNYIALSLITITVIINFSYFHEDLWFPNLTDSQKLSSAEFIRQSGAGLMDYWPKNTTQFPQKFGDSQPKTIWGSIVNINFVKNSQLLSGQLFVTSPSTEIIFPQTYFPNWQLYLNGQVANYTVNPQFGQLQLNLPQGDYFYTFRFINTPLRTFANLLSLIGLCLYIIKIKREKK